MSSRDKACNAVQLAVGHTFTNKDLLLEALDTTGMRTAESNQRLAMLGDALLKTILLDSWYAGGTAKGLLTP
jgi:ribonuclease-3